MATFTFFHSFTPAVAAGTHAAMLNADTDTVKAYLTNTTPSVTTHTVKADLAEIAFGNGYAAPIDATNAFTLSAGVISVDGSIATITAAGGAIAEFRYVVLYNDTAASDELIGYWDYGSAVNLADTQSFTVTIGTEMFKVGG